MASLQHKPRGPDVSEEISRIVSQAARHSGFLRAGEQAYRLSRTYPNCGKTGGELVDAIVSEAVKAGVAVEISAPRF